MHKLLLRSPAYYWKLGETRLLRPMFWNFWTRDRINTLTDEEFKALYGYSGPSDEFAQQFHQRARLGFFFHPRNQKDFFLNLLTKTQSEESILEEAQDVLENNFDTLGSGKVSLGEKINWHKDFKSGKVWGLKPPLQLDIMDLKNPTDVKVPWELSRFHQVWWLGKAYWLTRNERYAEKFKELVSDWIEKNPPGIGVNWANGMEPAIRASNWIAGYYFFCESKSIKDEFWLRMFKSLYAHGVFIRNHLEYTWRNGNHLLSDIVGLILIGLFFRDTTFGRGWLAWGTKNLEVEMEAQVLPDGVDYEKSTSYQRLVVELFHTATILCDKNKIPLSSAYMSRLEKTYEFVQSYVRPDGTIPLFGDADDGRLYRFKMLDEINDHRHLLSVGAILFSRADFKTSAGKFYQDSLWLFGGEGFEKYQMLQGETPQLNSRAYTNGGFYIMRDENVHVMVDAGEIGMGGMGGHGHNDTLSFEYWANNESVIVDSGTYAYTFDVPARQEFRSMRSHNVVIVDGREIARFVGLWLIMTDPTNPKVFEWSSNAAKDILEAAHYAYKSLSSPVIHRRRFELNKESGRLEIVDFLEGNGEHTVETFYHFSPHVDLEIQDPQHAVAISGKNRFALSSDAGDITKLETWYSRSYGVRVRNKTLRFASQVRLPKKFSFSIVPQS